MIRAFKGSKPALDSGLTRPGESQASHGVPRTWIRNTRQRSPGLPSSDKRSQQNVSFPNEGRNRMSGFNSTSNSRSPPNRTFGSPSGAKDILEIALQGRDIGSLTKVSVKPVEQKTTPFRAGPPRPPLKINRATNISSDSLKSSIRPREGTRGNVSPLSTPSLLITSTERMVSKTNSGPRHQPQLVVSAEEVRALETRVNSLQVREQDENYRSELVSIYDAILQHVPVLGGVLGKLRDMHEISVARNITAAQRVQVEDESTDELRLGLDGGDLLEENGSLRELLSSQEKLVSVLRKRERRYLRLLSAIRRRGIDVEDIYRTEARSTPPSQVEPPQEPRPAPRALFPPRKPARSLEARVDSNINASRDTTSVEPRRTVGSLNLKALEASGKTQKGFHEEFMDRLDEFSLSWRMAAANERKL